MMVGAALIMGCIVLLISRERPANWSNAGWTGGRSHSS